MIIDAKYLMDNPNHIFVFGDNIVHKGHGGAAALRDYNNTYGFITKKLPNNNDSSFFREEEYRIVYRQEIFKLRHELEAHSDKLFLISKLGAGLANRYKIFETIIDKQIKQDLNKYGNVKFLW